MAKNYYTIDLGVCVVLLIVFIIRAIKPNQFYFKNHLKRFSRFLSV